MHLGNAGALVCELNEQVTFEDFRCPVSVHFPSLPVDAERSVLMRAKLDGRADLGTADEFIEYRGVAFQVLGRRLGEAIEQFDDCCRFAYVR